jgi:sterol 14-demethylase
MLRSLLRRRPADAPPLARTRVPLVGPAIAFGRDPLAFLADCRRRHGDVFTVDLLAYRMTFMIGEAEQRRFFRAKDDELDLKSAVEVDNGYAMIRRGLLKEAALAPYVASIRAEAGATFERWARRGEVDLFPAISELVTRINLASLLGLDALARHGDAIAGAYYDVERHGTTPLAILFPRVPSPDVRRAAAARARIEAIIERIVADRRALPPDEQARRTDYLQLWLDDRAPDGSPRRPAQIHIHLLSLLFAAHTNTAGTMAWTLANLLTHPDARERALAEQHTLVAEHGPGLEFAQLRRMRYLDACMKETVRQRFTTMLVRRAARPFAIGPYVVPEGELVCISPILLHTDPAIFPDPHRFDPDRFADDVAERELVNRHVFVQFGYGAHRCLGAMFADTVLKTAWSILLRDYELALPGPPPRPDWTKSLGTPFAAAPTPLRIRRRP